MSLSWRQKWLPLIIAVTVLLSWLALSLGPHLAGAVPLDHYAHSPVLIQAEELKTLIDRKDPDLRLIDFRHKAKYYLGHIPGAIQMWRKETEDRSQPKSGLPASARQIEKLLGHLGIGSKDNLVIYSDRCDHTRLWWLLAHYGFPLDRMRLLDGGIEAWKAKGYPIQLTSPRFKLTSFRFPPGSAKNFLLATRDEVHDALGALNCVILDVRPPQLYQGEINRDGAARPGHIPGAVGIFWQENRVASGPDKGCFKSVANLRELYASQGVTPEKDIYIYGHTNLGASYTLVSLYLAGYPLDRLHLYAGAWIDWSRSHEAVARGQAR